MVLVEDDPNIADLVDLYLRQAGYRVYQAADGERGLELIEQRQPSIVILDIGLAGRARRPRRLPPGPGVEPGGRVDAHRPRRRDRPRPRARDGRRRLPHQAVLAPRAGGTGEGDPASGRRTPTRCAVRDPARDDRGRHRSARGPRRRASGPPRRPRVRVVAVLGREPRAWPSVGANCSTRCGGTTGSATSGRSTSTSASCARSSATASSSPPCGVSAIGSTSRSQVAHNVVTAWVRS